MANKQSRESQGQKKPARIGLFVVLVLVGALSTVAVVGWGSLLKVLPQYITALEHTAPTIEILEAPRGIGIAPAAFKFRLKDEDSGLDEVVVRTHQRGGQPKELLRQSLHGIKVQPLTVKFPGDKSDLEEGIATLEIKVFDRSFWSNSDQKTIPLRVDYRRPKVEVITTQHNAVFGGGQLLFYRAFDEHLAVSGVKVGNRTFYGFPARGIDKAFSDPALFAVFYAIDFAEDPEGLLVKVFAEDEVGNAVSLSSFNHHETRRSRREGSVKLGEDSLREYVRNLYDRNSGTLRKIAEDSGQDPNFDSRKGSTARLIEEFRDVNEKLREINENELVSRLQSPRFEKSWDDPFLQQPGTISGAYGDLLRVQFEGQEIGTVDRRGYEVTLPQDHREVFAANDGIVIFSENLGVYGRVVAIDHGLGLATVYGYLESASVKRGDTVKLGQNIGTAAVSELSHSARVYLEMRVNGVPVDLREWWDKQWVYAHVTAKINEVKRTLGIPVYRPLD